MNQTRTRRDVDMLRHMIVLAFVCYFIMMSKMIMMMKMMIMGIRLGLCCLTLLLIMMMMIMMTKMKMMIMGIRLGLCCLPLLSDLSPAAPLAVAIAILPLNMMRI